MTHKTVQDLRTMNHDSEPPIHLPYIPPLNTELATLAPHPVNALDAELTSLRALRTQLADLAVSFDRIIGERDDLRQLVGDLRRELAATLAERDGLRAYRENWQAELQDALTERDQLRAALERARR